MALEKSPKQNKRVKHVRVHAPAKNDRKVAGSRHQEPLRPSLTRVASDIHLEQQDLKMKRATKEA